MRIGSAIDLRKEVHKEQFQSKLRNDTNAPTLDSPLSPSNPGNSSGGGGGGGGGDYPLAAASESGGDMSSPGGGNVYPSDLPSGGAASAAGGTDADDDYDHHHQQPVDEQAINDAINYKIQAYEKNNDFYFKQLQPSHTSNTSHHTRTGSNGSTRYTRLPFCLCLDMDLWNTLGVWGIATA